MSSQIDNLINNASQQAQQATAQNQNQQQHDQFHQEQGQQMQGQQMQGQNQQQAQFNPNQQVQGQNQQAYGQQTQFNQNQQVQGQNPQQTQFNPNQQVQGQNPQQAQFNPNQQVQGQQTQFDPNQQQTQFNPNQQVQGNHLPAVYDHNGQLVPQQQPVHQNAMMAQQNQMPQQAHNPVTVNQMPQVDINSLPVHLQAYAVAKTMTMDALDAMGMQVDHWLKPTFSGMNVGESPAIANPFKVFIQMEQNEGFILGYGLRYGKEPVQYDFTRDSIVSDKTGQPWMNSLAQAVATDQSARPYSSVQIIMELAENATAHDGTVLAEQGESLGYTTPQSNWAAWSGLYKQCAKRGLLGQRVEVTLTCQARTKDKNRWGTVEFTLVEDSQQANTQQANTQQATNQQATNQQAKNQQATNQQAQEQNVAQDTSGSSIDDLIG